MLTRGEIESNEAEFISLLRNIDIPGADIDGLITYLKSTDFFAAPASVRFTGAYEGGLCQQSLNIYKILCRLCDTFTAQHVMDENGLVEVQIPFDKNSLIIVGLFSNLYKANFYMQYVKNEKVYSETGAKFDSMGKFDWVPKVAYQVREPIDRDLYGSKGFTNVVRLQKFIPLSEEETTALMNHFAGTDKQENTDDLSFILNRFNLTVYLHCANMMAAYCMEKIC